MRTSLSLLCIPTILIALLVPDHARASGQGDLIPMMDLHSDILLRVLDNEVDLLDPPTWPQTTIPEMRAGGIQDQIFAVWVNQRTNPGAEATHRALRLIDALHGQLARHPEHLALATTLEESEEIRASGRIAAWLFIEGASPLNNDLALLRTFHRLGVRGITLTWNYNLDWAGSSSDRDNDQMGLTDFGREVVREMNRLGMVIDVSHASERTFWDVLETTTQPIMASHSACRALVDHDRNLTDDQLRALAANGGVIGMVLLPSYLSAEWSGAWSETEANLEAEIATLLESLGGDSGNPLFREGRRRLIQAALPEHGKVTMETYLDHVEHAVRVAGIRHVAIGADFDGIWAFPEGIERPSHFPAVAEGLRRRGFDDDAIRAIFHENARRVVGEVTSSSP